MSDATQDPTLDPTLAPEDATEAAQQPEDPTTSDMSSPATQDGLAEVEPTEENTAPEAPAPEFEPTVAGADEDKTDAEAPAAKTEDHTSDFAGSDSASDFHVDTPTSDMSDVAAANQTDPNSNDAPAKVDEAAGKDGVKGDGDTHGGTDTPETLIQNPADPVTGKPIDGSGQPKGVVMGGSGSLNHPTQDMAGAFGTSGGDDSALPNGSDDSDDADEGDDYLGADRDDDSDEDEGGDTDAIIGALEDGFAALLGDVRAMLNK